MLQDGVAGSSRTLSKMSYKLRKVCQRAIKRRERRGKQRIGRGNEFVMLDESNFYHKRKVCVNCDASASLKLGPLLDRKSVV